MKKCASLALLATIPLGLLLSLQAAEPVPVTGANATSGEVSQERGELDAAAALMLDRRDLFNNVDGALLIHSLPVLTLLEGRRFPIAGDLARMGTTPDNLFPLAFLRAVEVEKSSAALRSGSDAVGGTVNLRRKEYSFGGEAGVFYGKSSGRYGREDFETYLIGGVGTDKVQITVGASHRESTGSYQRGQR